MPATFDAQPQPIPIAAAAMLSGIYGFLSEIPQLVERRDELQRRRRVDDRDLLERFGTHWLAPSGSRLQAEHQAMHEPSSTNSRSRRSGSPRGTDERHRGVSAGRPLDDTLMPTLEIASEPADEGGRTRGARHAEIEAST